MSFAKRREPLMSADWETLESELDPAVARQIQSVYERVVSGAVPSDLDIYELYAWRCRDCGVSWNPRLHRATRFRPAYVECEECPACGGPPEDG